MTTNLRTKLVYPFLAPFYDKITLPNSLSDFVRSLELKDGASILDAGCGTGVVSFALAGKYPNSRVVAFDKSRKMLETANKSKKTQNLEFYLGDIEKVNPLESLDGKTLILEENSFDYVFVSGALEHVDIKRGTLELTRYLKSKGLFVDIGVNDALLRRIFGLIMGFKTYTKEEIENALREAKLGYVEELEIRNKKLRKYRIAIKAQKI